MTVERQQIKMPKLKQNEASFAVPMLPLTTLKISYKDNVLLLYYPMCIPKNSFTNVHAEIMPQ